MMTKTLNKHKKYLLFLILNIFFTFSYSQFFLSPEELYQEGEEFILAEEYNEALPDFMQIFEKGFKTANIYYKIGECYLFIHGKKENSIEYLEKAVNKASAKYIGESPDEDASPLRSLYLLGIAYRINNQFEKSQGILNCLKDSLSDNSELLAPVNNELKLCEHAQELIRVEISLKMNKLDEIINTSSSSFNPLVNSDETLIYFMDALKLYDAIMQSVNISGKWTKPVNLTPKIKSDGDYFVVGMSDDGKSLLLYRYDPYTKGDIYVCENINGKWDKIKKLNDNINTQFNETHASFANNGNTLYFTSNREGGYGGLDIYKSDKDKNGEWGAAVNLGYDINTFQNEETPFLTGDSKLLYFSSQGHFNMGGYDIFISNLNDNGEWSNPSNIGYPLNTADDDLFYFPLKDGSIGYQAKYTDNISGTMDIYRFEVLSKANPARFTVKGQITAKQDEPLSYEKIKITLVDKEKNDTLNTRQAEKDGKYIYKLPSGMFELNFYADTMFIDKKSISLPEYLTLDELIVDTKIDTKLLADHDILKPQQKLPDEKQAVASDVKIQIISKMDTIILKNILFGFDNYSITVSSTVYLSKLADILKKYPEIAIRLNGYTDAFGNEEYNMILSERRANTVEKHLISLNIEKTRITVKGFGEESPVALNKNMDGSDNPKGRKYNRRVEIALEKIPENVIIINQSDIPKELLVK